MVVRHPFVRIVSAFRDKLEALAEHNVRSLNICPKFGFRLLLSCSQKFSGAPQFWNTLWASLNRLTHISSTGTTWRMHQGWHRDEHSTPLWQTARLFQSKHFIFPQNLLSLFLYKSIICFSRFVDYLIRTPPNLMDKHWAPYSKVIRANWRYYSKENIPSVWPFWIRFCPNLGSLLFRCGWLAIGGSYFDTFWGWFRQNICCCTFINCNDLKVCLPCNISYSAILRLETIQQVGMIILETALAAPGIYLSMTLHMMTLTLSLPLAFTL